MFYFFTLADYSLRFTPTQSFRSSAELIVFNGRLVRANDDYVYISSNLKSSNPFEIRLIGVPRVQLSQAFVGVVFYNPQVIQSSTSNDSVIFAKWKAGLENTLNHAADPKIDPPSFFNLPNLISKEACGNAQKYFGKARGN